MAIAVDASVTRWTGTPSGTTAITSASFTPANNSLIVLCVNSDEGVGTPVALAVSGGGLTWTERVRRGDTESGDGLASIWTAPVTTGASMTIAVNRSSGDGGTSRLSAKAYLVTGQHASPIGNSNSADWTTNPQTLNVTAAGAGRMFGCGTDWNQTGVPVSTDTEDGADYSGAISVMSAFKAADHASGSQSIQFDPVGTPTGNVVVLEILAAAGGGDVTLALTGQAINDAQGTLAPSTSIQLTGQSLSGSLGVLTPALSKGLSGSAIATGVGTLVPSLALVLTGIQISISQGTVGASGSATAALTGQAIVSAQGTLIPANSLSPSGQALAAAGGALSSSTSKALTGSSLTSSQGTLVPTLSLVLTGLQITIGQGALSAPGNVTVQLTGQLLTGAQGTLTPGASKGLSGIATAITGGTLIPALSRTLTGGALVAVLGSVGTTATVLMTGSVLTATLGAISVFDPSIVPGAIDNTRLLRVSLRIDTALRVEAPDVTLSIKHQNRTIQ